MPRAALETVDGALLEDVSITNVTMRDIVNAPIFLRLGSRMRAPDHTPVGALRRLDLSNFVIHNADPRFASIISGIPGHDIEDVRLHNIRIEYQGGGTREQAALVPAELEMAYPEPRMFGEMPAYGFFVRHVNGIEMKDIQISFLKEDLRPAFVFQEVKSVSLQNIKAQHAPGVPTFDLREVTNLDVRQSPGLPDTTLKNAAKQTF